MTAQRMSRTVVDEVDEFEEIRRELVPTETLLWYGKPASGIRCRFADIYLIPLLAIWGVVMSELLATFTRGGYDEFDLFLFLWFLTGGFYHFLGRFILSSRIRLNTTYGLTNERIIIRRGIFRKTTKSLNLYLLPEMNLTEIYDGSGTITFGNDLVRPGWVYLLGSSATKIPTFEMIQDARKVYELIRGAQLEDRR